MHAFAQAAFPFDLRWDAQDLADAVPLRLHQRVDFDALRRDPCVAPRGGAGPWRRHYAGSGVLAPRFVVQ